MNNFPTDTPPPPIMAFPYALLWVFLQKNAVSLSVFGK